VPDIPTADDRLPDQIAPRTAAPHFLIRGRVGDLATGRTGRRVPDIHGTQAKHKN
jgi:hypothetical protein